MGTEDHKSNSEIDIDYGELQEILNELEDKKDTVSEATGALRSRIKAVVDETGWHKGALAKIREIDAMSETARADFLRTFEPMFDAMVSQKWRDEMQDLFKDETEYEPAAAE